MQYHKSQRDLTDREVMLIHLSTGAHIVSDGVMLSTLCTLDAEMRHAAAYEYSKHLLPLTGAFSILDQLGTCYSNSTIARYPDENASGIKKCLYYFSGYRPNDDETKALYALRNGLIHDASLFSKDLHGNNHHHFAYDRDQAVLLTLPEQRWDGTLENVVDVTTTVINPEILISLATDSISNASTLNEHANLTIELAEGSSELKHRYIRYVYQNDRS